MKKIFYFLLLFFMGIFSNSCTKLLEKSPMDQISDAAFWKSEGDLQLYLNGLYATFPGWNGGGGVPLPDAGTDIAISSGLFLGTKSRLDGNTNVPASGGGWSWTNVRNVNYFLENFDKVAAVTLKDHYAGEAYFFRAWFYFELLKQFGDLPIITKTVNVADQDILFGTRSSRTDVVNFIVSDLDKAIAKMKLGSQVGAGRLNKNIALLFKARVCLYEGTWEKYHANTPFKGTSDGSAFLTLAASASKALMDAANYSLVTGNTKSVYYTLFNQIDYSKNTEVLFYRQYNTSTLGALGQGNALNVYPNCSGITRDMVRSYLCTDGLPISVSPLYQGDLDIRQVILNRDPRCEQTLINPGDVMTVTTKNDTIRFVTAVLTGINNCPTGYQAQKFYQPKVDPLSGGYSAEIGYIMFRYAEALLIYAESKAELAQLTQADLDLSINKLRQRVGMPSMTLATITTDPAWPDYGYVLPNYLKEIRRERAIEMFSEGLRLDDLMRWRAHSLLSGKRPIGAFYTAEMKTINNTLVADATGYLDPFKTSLSGIGNTWGFRPDKDYLKPLPIYDLTLNKKLNQNPGW